MKTSEVLTKAAEIIMEGGHLKGSYDEDDKRCVLGACAQAVWGPRRAWKFIDIGDIPGYRELESVVGAQPHNWNDCPETTEAMVLGALHDAALLAKEQGD